MSSIRIEITGQSSFNSPVKIDRAQPLQLAQHISTFQWESFCNTIDEALAPITHTRKNATRQMMCGFGISLVIFALNGILGATGLAFSIYWLMPIIGIAFVAVPACMSSSAVRTATNSFNEVIEEVRTILSAESSKSPCVSFHLKEDETLHISSYSSSRFRISTRLKYYIECYVNDGSAGVLQQGETVVTNATLVTATAVQATPVSMFDNLANNAEAGTLTGNENNNDSKTSLERLQELEALKSLITEDEYNRKKAEILDSI